MADAKNRQNSDAKKGGNNSKILIIGGAVVIVALVVVIIVLLTGRNAQPEETPTPQERRNVVVTEDNVEDVLNAMMEDTVESGNYMVTMNTTWHFGSGTSVSDNAYVENDASNTNDVYFDVTLDDTGELIYSSPVLPLGSHIESIALDKDLDAGTYPCIVTYTLVDEDQQPVDTLQVALTIEVES